MSTDPTALQNYIDRLANITPHEVKRIGDDGNTLLDGDLINGSVAHDLVLYSHNLHDQVTLIGAQIMHWGTLASRAKRVWQIVDRRLVTWKAEQRLVLESKDHPDATDAKGNPKKYTKAQAEDVYRTAPEYAVLNAEVERAEEAYNAADAVLAAFKQKARIMEREIYRAHDGTLQRSSI